MVKATIEMKISLNRIILFGKEIDKLKIFYQENFGFSLLEEIRDQWVVLNAGQTEIALHKIGRQYDSDEIFRAASNTKLVFGINGNLESIRNKLISNGVLLQDIKSFEGVNALFCDGEDPEGNIFQLEQRLNSL
jgi:predicted enzyme related to lactoylglutathione lyase